MTPEERTYGNALYSLAVQENLQDDVLQGLELVVDLFTQNPDYPKLLANPAIKKEDRLSMLDTALRESVHVYVLNFLKILCEKYALNMVKGCAEEYRSSLYADRGILPVVATSAVALTQDQQDALRQTVGAKTGKTILLQNIVDASMLGGVKLSYAGKELDGSVAGRLHAIRTVLTAQS